MATSTKQRTQSLSEQARVLALLECQAHGEQIADRSRPLPASIQNSLERTINDLAALMFADHMQRHP